MIEEQVAVSSKFTVKIRFEAFLLKKGRASHRAMGRSFKRYRPFVLKERLPAILFTMHI
jgi:hypothetical protein